MTEETERAKKAPAKGTSTLQAALLLLVIGVVSAGAGATMLGWLFIIGAIICAVVGGIQRDQARS